MPSLTDFGQEVLVVASLGVIFVDVLQRELLSEPNGLPLGLLTSKQQFSQIQYLFSPELRFGLSSLSRIKLLAFGLFIVTSAVISLFAGPSAALLLIPEHRSGWPAGGVSMWLAGDDDVLWPSRLTYSDIGGPHCVSPSHELLLSENLSHVDCVWAGLSPIAELYKQAHFTPVSLSIRDGVVNRDFSLGYLSVDPETWASAPHLAVSRMSNLASRLWFSELLSVPYHSKYHTMRWRTMGETVASLQAWAPAVRTTCAVFDSFTYNDSAYLQVLLSCSSVMSGDVELTGSKVLLSTRVRCSIRSRHPLACKLSHFAAYKHVLGYRSGDCPSEQQCYDNRCAQCAT